MGEMRRAIEREREEYRVMERFSSTIVIAASIIAAVRLAREDISESNPKLLTVVHQCVGLARTILKTVVR